MHIVLNFRVSPYSPVLMSFDKYYYAANPFGLQKPGATIFYQSTVGFIAEGRSESAAGCWPFSLHPEVPGFHQIAGMGKILSFIYPSGNTSFGEQESLPHLVLNLRRLSQSGKYLSADHKIFEYQQIHIRAKKAL